MEQPLTLNKNGQINIVLNNEKMKLKVTKASKSLDKQQEIIHAKHEPLMKIEKEMDALVGMDGMKKVIKEIYAWIYINKVREEHGLLPGGQVLHMLFKGNPGTGKTTVARLIGKLLKEMNALSKGHLIEAERADLVGEYIGHTAQKTRELIKKAMGGILFIDEAYSLARGGEKDFGKEAIDTLVKNMEDKQNDFILILAGYAKEMDQFLSLNPGLRSRFPLVIEFPDYTVDQLMEIARKMVKERQYVLSKDAEWKLREHLQAVKYNRSPHVFSNGRYIRNCIEKAIRAQALRLLVNDTYDKKELETIKSEDLTFGDF
ncbi:stage V sporulation protein K [Calidifontibacillus erzurumensis]|uniref:Stage V sporulation protein K n=1 Tax=Calidifontibacillus erzurumensis TaxID=2741433 RepID=A0A8J8KDV3_9BACI|nr:stage V sporulation protein K [Calidifontibacillus erzurumensis]NSL51100.1 stage V sporulation protein K [Calidifontibacillus erzurumensis]